ncbi:MAG: M48 family metallopeptidase [Mariprofundaceae bacterium]|nr:M48 family metallopeptidase [Mariprofundaceae bacterium]
MSISGHYYPENVSQAQVANMAYEQGYCILSVQGEVVAKSLVNQLNISERLGNMLRQVRFENGALFESKANDDIDALLKAYGQQRTSSWLHRLESKSITIIPLLLVALFVAWASYQWALPKLVHVAAFALPSSQLGMIGEGTLELLDESLLSPSQLGAKQQQTIRLRFQKLTQETGSGFDYQLYFRRMPDNVPNAFALPDGSIILMDGLVDISDHPWQVDSVLLHEIGHVEQRHSLQMILHDTFITLIASVMLGEAISTSDSIAALPLLLMQNQYSQQFEQDSDDFASQYMLKHHIDTKHFAHALQNLEAAMRGNDEANTSSTTEQKNEAAKEAETDIWSYFSSHPSNQQRIQRLLEQSSSNPSPSP